MTLKIKKALINSINQRLFIKTFISYLVNIIFLEVTSLRL